MESRYRGAAPLKGVAKSTVHRVTTAETQQFVILSKSVFGQMIHWAGNRSHECTKESKKCNGCERGWPEKWLGYLHVINVHAEHECFLELTLTACNLLDKQVAPGENFRGVQVRIRKTKGGAKGRYLVEVMPRRVDDVTLPQEKDPVETLRFLWRCKNHVLKAS